MVDNSETNVTPQLHPTRRAFLGKVVTLGAAGLGAVAMGVSPRDTKAPDVFPPRPVEDYLKDFESSLGDDRLIFEQASAFTQLILEQAVQLQGIPTNAQNVFQDVIILSEDFEDGRERRRWNYTQQGSPKELVDAHPIVQQLKKDYLGKEFSDELLSQIMDSMSSGAFGWVEKGKIFLSLKRVNYPDRTAFDVENEEKKSQFQDINHKVQCQKAQPAVHFRSVLTHELEHYAIDETEQIDSPVLREVYQERDAQDSRQERQLLGIQKNGFILSSTYLQDGRKMTSTESTLLDEFVVDYLAAQASMKAHLPFTTNYANPNNYKNFQEILQRSGISDEDLRNLHRGSQLETLLIRIVQSAGGVSFANEKEMVAFGVDLFLNRKVIQQNGRSTFLPHFDWDKIKNYYGFIDSRDYNYSQPSFNPTAKLPGCIVR